MKKTLGLAGCFLFIIFQSAFCDVKLPRLISNGMVLQRDADVKIWGWANVGEKVSINFNGQTYNTETDPNGKWLVTLSPLKAGGPYDMVIDANNPASPDSQASRGGHITLKNILIGDVWICSGQSNMELEMERVEYKYPDVISKSENKNIRQFTVPDRYVFELPQADLQSGNWQSANPQTILQFTAVGYFFAKNLYEKYNVPIGLINTSLGGSPAEAWMSEDALKAFPAHLETANKFKDPAYRNGIEAKDKAVSDAWYNKLEQHDKGMTGQRWYDPNLNSSDWPTMNVPGFWADQGLGNTNGVVWFRKEINVPASMVGKPAQLWLGRIVNGDTAYVNGKPVGTITYEWPPRIYDIPSNLLKKGTNVIAVRVTNTSGRGGFVPDKRYELIAAGQTIDLKGPWRYKLGAVMDPLPPSTFIRWQPEGLYNGMIAPLLNYSIKGVIWYQGESNTGNPIEYKKLFPALIADWRQKWNQGDFPFLYVQLANFMEAKKELSESGWAQLRQAQLKTLSVPNTAMAVITDIGEWNDIHPLNKEDVGKRLALAAQKVAYGDSNVIYSGPIYQSMKIEGNKIIISFTNVGSGLIAKGGQLKYFAIAGADKKFVWADAKIEGNNIIVFSDKVGNPIAVRYAWADNPQAANLYNKEGLPASPFETNE